MTWRRIATLVVATGLVAGCSSSHSPSGRAGGNTSSTVSSSSKSGPLTAWCSLAAGQTKAQVLATMGTPHGTKAKAALTAMNIPTTDYAEWDVGGDILLATFEGAGGTVSNLQAYAGAVGPSPATDLACPAFRHGS